MIKLNVNDNEVDLGDSDVVNKKSYYQDQLHVQLTSGGRAVHTEVISLPMVDDLEVNLIFRPRADTDLELVQRLDAEKKEEERIEASKASALETPQTFTGTETSDEREREEERVEAAEETASNVDPNAPIITESDDATAENSGDNDADGVIEPNESGSGSVTGEAGDNSFKLADEQ